MQENQGILTCIICVSSKTIAQREQTVTNIYKAEVSLRKLSDSKK